MIRANDEGIHLVGGGAQLSPFTSPRVSGNTKRKQENG
jgi:hypothetical protein